MSTVEVGTRTLEVLEGGSTRLMGCNIGKAYRIQRPAVEVEELQNCDGELPEEGDDSGVDTELT